MTDATVAAASGYSLARKTNKQRLEYESYADTFDKLDRVAAS
jgi:hypothetical protein